MDGRAVLEKLEEMTRREMISRAITTAGWGSFALVLGAGALETVRFFFPRVLFHPPSRFKVGAPAEFVAAQSSADAYGVILVDERWKSRQRFFIVRENDRLYALSARCAHLGCTVNWFADLRTFKCPCHGSEYHSNGVPFAGPAPRPLDRLRIELDLDGEIVVDTSIVYGSDRFHVNGAFVAV